jgi:hypothetical protein
MIRKIRVRAISFFAIICLIVPLISFQTGAVAIPYPYVIDVGDYTDSNNLKNDINDTLAAAGAGATITIWGTNGTLTGAAVQISISANNQTIVWQAQTPSVDVHVQTAADRPFTFYMDDANVNRLQFENITAGTDHYIEIGHGTHIGILNIGNNCTVNVGHTVIIDDPQDAFGGLNEFEENVEEEPIDETEDPEPEPDPIEIGDEIKTSTPAGKNEGGALIVTITDNEPFEEDGLKYAGKVDIKEFFTDTPKSIPKVVFIKGKRYLVGDVVYIVAKKDLEIVGYTKTGLAYIFPAVENVDNPVVFTASSLPEGLALTEDGILYTETLPLKRGITEITVTADNGVDTHEIKVKINIKPEYKNTLEFKTDLSQNDKEDTPELLDEDGTKKPVGDVLNLWISGELRLHYDPELDDFETLFLDGRPLIEGTDYTTEEGSTVIVLTEQTMIPLASGDHVVTTMFHQNTDLGMDTVINDVGSSSFVFRFGDDKTSGKRVNIGGDGVTGSVTFDDTTAKEEPITTITANSEAIERRAANLSNATGREIIAAFETKQHGGFGGKTATFAISAQSLGLTLKNGTVVYVAVYDSKTGKTYQNKGEIKDGMIVFRTVHSGVFMVALEKF